MSLMVATVAARTRPPIRARALELLSGDGRDCCAEALLRAGLFLLFLVVASSANATELLPRKFVGSWCLDSKTTKQRSTKSGRSPVTAKLPEIESSYARTALIPLKADVF
jgi:hypothetical protein